MMSLWGIVLVVENMKTNEIESVLGMGWKCQHILQSEGKHEGQYENYAKTLHWVLWKESLG